MKHNMFEVLSFEVNTRQTIRELAPRLVDVYGVSVEQQRLLFKGKDSISNMLTQFTAYQAVKLRLGGRPGPAIERRLLERKRVAI